jgi:hypothetical protein
LHRQHEGKQFIERNFVIGVEVAERVMVHADAATEPAIRIVLLAEPRHLTRAAHALGRRPQPQRHQQLRIGCRAARLLAARFQGNIETRQIQPLHYRPQRPNLMFRRQKLLQRTRPQRHLAPIRPPQPRRGLII